MYKIFSNYFIYSNVKSVHVRERSYRKDEICLLTIVKVKR